MDEQEMYALITLEKASLLRPATGMLNARDACRRQRGVVLFFALIALVVMSLAAVALIRSVDTSTLIAGNLAFRQSARTAGDRGFEDALSWLGVNDAAMDAAGISTFLDPGCPTNCAHTFNKTNTAVGYYSNIDNLNLFADATWNISGIPEAVDSSGNHTRYIIQRVCRDAFTRAGSDHCLFTQAILDGFGRSTPVPASVCYTPPGAVDYCPKAGQSPQYRITVRTVGPSLTVSYLQAIVN
jgi:Tfp pilus assembly protein PilX